MIHIGYLTWILFSWGLTVASVKTLPHVMKYQTLIPHRLKDSSVMNDAATHQKYPDVLQYSLTIEGQNLTLHLERNIDLIGKNFSVTHYSDENSLVTTIPDPGFHCYYHGHIVEVEASSASVGLCSGIKGFVLLWDQMYHIEPLDSHEAGQEGDRESSKAHSDEGLHIVYNYKHLRRKRRSCSQGNMTTFYDHGAYPSGLFQLSSVRSEAQTNVKSRTVELVLVADHTEYKRFNSNKTVETRMLEIANHVDKLYRPMGIRVMLVGVDIWSYRDEITVSTKPELTLNNFLDWRQRTLLPRTKHDNAQFVTGVNFEGPTVGLASISAMCTSKSGGVNEDNSINPIGVATTVAHEMGHNLGLTHDTDSCVCDSSTKNCIMAERVGLVYPKLFSRCSQQQLRTFLNVINPACLLDTPSTDRIHGGPVCGNAFVEPGEECDCGTKQECKNPCCNANTCKLKPRAQCAEGECCHNCQLKPTGSVCRPKAGDCDLAEYCTGFSASCPTDVYAQNGLLCKGGRGYCYNGKCPSKQDHCKTLWGPDADVATHACFTFYGNCRRTLFSPRCSSRDLFCGILFCSGGWYFPVTHRKAIYNLPTGQICVEATISPGDNFPADLVMVPTGTKCGHNMVCYNQRCQDFTTLKVYGSNNCSEKCNNNGVCDHKNQCHCNPGWAPPFCQEQQPELPKAKENIMVIIVSVAVGLLLLLVLVILSVMHCAKNRRPAKRFLQSTSGQLNPVFRSSSTTRGSPHFRNKLISPPTFVESSVTQHCKPLPSAAEHPHGVSLEPNRAAPVPPKTPKDVPAVPQPSNIQQAKPLPPSRPLPPLATKPIINPKPPMPPVKPKPSAIRSPLPHTQLLAGKTALMSPSGPR